MTDYEREMLASADRWFAYGLVAMGVCALLVVYAVAVLVREVSA